MKQPLSYRFFFAINFCLILLSSGSVFSQAKLTGMRQRGGTNDVGTIYSANADGSGFQKNYDFSTFAPGKNPAAALTENTPGEFYGTTKNGGSYNAGTLFKYNPGLNTYTVLINFRNNGDSGAYPQSKLLKALNGKFYGVASAGGQNARGVIFEFDPAGNNFQVKHDFDFVNGLITDTASSHSLMQAPNGKIYGCTDGGGINGTGALFECDGNGDNYLKLKDFDAASGSFPTAEMVVGPDGKLYGMTVRGGVYGFGTVFSYDLINDVLANIHDFQNTSNDGAFPQGGLLVYNNLLWGTTTKGGANGNGYLFSINTLGTVLNNYNSFSSSTGSFPYGTLITGNATAGQDTLFGFTKNGGDFDYGTFFYYVPSNGSYGFSSLDNFTLGSNPICGAAQSSLDNKFYGLTFNGGAIGSGTMVVARYNGIQKKLDFNSPGLNGGAPISTLFQASNHRIYGTSELGGTNNTGVIFEFHPTTNSITILGNFNLVNGSKPKGGLVEHSNGKIYGTTYEGGVNNGGTIFELDTATNNLVSVFNLSSSTGTKPSGIPLLANNGNIFITTQSEGPLGAGTLLEFNPINQIIQNRHSFSSAGGDGTFPKGGPIQAANGNIYGMTSFGGAFNLGTIYRYKIVDNSYVIMASFNGAVTGANPDLSILNDINGVLYGVTPSGGSSNLGAVISYNYTTANLNAKSFTLSFSEGNQPMQLKASNNGKLYGTSISGGSFNQGTLFEYDPVSTNLSGLYSFTENDGSAFADGLLLIDCEKPVITQNLPDATSCPGGTISITVSETGGTAYQWYKNNVPVAGANSPTLTNNAVAFTDSGWYHCKVGNACGYTVSNFFWLDVQNVSAITAIPTGPTSSLCPDDTVTIVTSAVSGFTYQWYLDGIILPSETQSSIDAYQDGDYTVVISAGIGCSSTSNAVNLEVLPFVVPTVTITGSTDTICSPQSVEFTATSTNSSNGSIPAFYQWFLNGNPIAGEINDTLVLNNLNNFDSIRIQMISTALCATPNNVVSNIITIIDTCANAPTLSTNNPPNSVYCAGSVIQVPFTVSAPFYGSNVFTAQLSDAAGNFTNPINLGSASGYLSGSISAQIPFSLVGGTNYKIRVVASNPVVIGSSTTNLDLRSNNFNLDFTADNTVINFQPPVVTLTNNNLQANYTYLWFFGDGQHTQSNNATVSYGYTYNGVYTLSLLAIDNAGCYDTLTKPAYVQVNTVGLGNCNHTVNISPSGLISACQGSPVALTASTSAVNPYYQWNRNGVSIPGETTNTLLVNQNGSYTLTVFENNACPRTSSAVVVNYNQSSATPPVISANGTSLVCGALNYTLTATGGGSFSNYLWSNGQSGNSITINQGGTYTVTGQTLGCDATSAPFVISNTTAPVPEICMISVDTALGINKNRIIWENPTTDLIDSVLIFREDTLPANAGVYHHIGSVDYDSDGEFVDNGSLAKLRAYKYRLAVLDTCGGISPFSNPQKSMHLTNTPGNSLTQRQLLWNNYEGQPQGITWYLIYRENFASTQFELIDSVPAPQTWYQDNGLTSLSDTLRRYTVDYRLADPCDPSRAAKRRCNSNSAGHERLIRTGTDKLQPKPIEFSVYPNPAYESFEVFIDSKSINGNASIEIRDLLGRLISRQELNQRGKTTFSTHDLKAGTYVLVMRSGESFGHKKLIISK